MKDISEIRSLVEKYLETLDYRLDQEMFMTPRGFADWQLGNFLAWLKNRMNDKIKLCRN